MPQTLRRSLSRPLADLSNLVRPRARSPAPTKVGDAAQAPAPLVDLPLTDTPSFTPTLDNDDDDDELDTDSHSPLPFRNSFESRQWKECTPILDDPVGEALAEQSLSFSRLPSGAFDTLRGFVPCEGTVDGGERYGDADEGSGDGFEIHGLDASSEYSSRPGSLFDYDDHDDNDGDGDAANQRNEDDEHNGSTATTPDTSLPLSSSPWSETWTSPLDATCPPQPLERTPPPSRPTATPPRPRPPIGHFVELVETCPTPPSASASTRTEDARRRSLLVASALGTACAADEGDELPVAATGCRTSSRAPSRCRSHSRSRARSSRPGSPCSSPSPAEESLAASPPGSHPSARASPDAHAGADAAHCDTYTCRPRLRRSLSGLFAPDDAARAPSPRPPSRRTPRHRPSTATLLTADLARLAAPDSPLEARYRVSWREVLCPTAFLDGGRGTGRYGDGWGAVEGRVERRRAEGSGRSSWVGAREEARRRRREDRPDAEDARRVDHFAVPASAAGVYRPHSGATGGLSRSGSFASVRRGLSKLSRRLSGVPPSATMSAEETSGAHEDKVRRRSSLAASLFGSGGWRREEERSVEELGQWVSVVIR